MSLKRQGDQRQFIWSVTSWSGLYSSVSEAQLKEQVTHSITRITPVQIQSGWIINGNNK